MDSSQRALQTKGKLFFQISKSFFELVKNFQNNSGVGFMQARWGGGGGGGICIKFFGRYLLLDTD